MKALLIAVATSALTLVAALAAGEGWTTDYEEAKKAAAEEKKSILLEFTGSDWCSPCIMLKKMVLSKPAFLKAVEDKLILVEIDSPNDTSKLTKELIEQNKKLVVDYRISGYPTLLLVDEIGRPFASTGGFGGQAPDAYVENLMELLSKRKKRDEGIARAATLEGLEKARVLVAVISGLELEEEGMIMPFYGDLIAQIKKADPGDEGNFVRSLESKSRFSAVESRLQELEQDEGLEVSLKFARQALNGKDFDVSQKQDLAYIVGDLLVALEKHEEAILSLEEAKKLDPEDTRGNQAFDDFIEEIRELMREEADSTKKE